jgi:DNA sulfur modification protein DndD
VRLAGIRLRNWKAFASLELDLSSVSGERNVAIVEGSNGYGKTSLLEALALGLYGREGVHLIGRAGGASRPDIGYDAFLERALHQGVGGHDANASVELRFEGDGEKRFTIQRIWYFTAAGKHRRSDEEVRIWDGPDEDLVPLPEGDEHFVEVRDIVSRTLLPPRLAPFFIFDGEHIDRLAGADLDQQVRLGLEHALGIPLLRRLADDLKTYARDRRRLVRGASGAALDELVNAVSDLAGQERRLTAELDEVALELIPLRKERDATVARIGALHGDSYASFKRLFEEREHCGRNRDALQDRLRQTLSSDLALALASAELRHAARAQIAVDARIEQTEATRAISEDRYQKIVAALRQPAELERLGLSSAQYSTLEARLRSIWTEVWGDGAETEARRVHTHLGEADRLLVDERLRATETLGAEQIAALAHEAERADEAVAAIDRRIADQRGTDDISQKLAGSLRDVQAAVGELEERSRGLTRSLDGVKADLAIKERALAKLRSQFEEDAPQLARADRADAVNRAIAKIVERLFPIGIGTLASGITRAYRAMAHKNAVSEVQIDPRGVVTLLDADGRDLRSIDPSAGESQIFAFALMAAISDMGPSFPIILDTPLARLDPDHRERVLRYFAGLDRQIIFLSQPAELSGRYLEMLRPQLGAVLELTHERGRSAHRRTSSPSEWTSA